MLCAGSAVMSLIKSHRFICAILYSLETQGKIFSKAKVVSFGSEKYVAPRTAAMHADMK